jgi:alpha-galactosidase
MPTEVKSKISKEVKNQQTPVQAVPTGDIKQVVGEFGATILKNPTMQITKIKEAFPEFSNVDDNVLGEL